MRLRVTVGHETEGEMSTASHGKAEPSRAGVIVAGVRLDGIATLTPPLPPPGFGEACRRKAESPPRYWSFEPRGAAMLAGGDA